MEAIKTSVTNSQEESEKNGKVVKKSGKRIGYNYIILKSLKKSPKNDVVTCLYIKSLTDFGVCVIKEGTYGDSKDKLGRDIKDRLAWQKQLHEFLQDKVRLPRLLGSFEENGNYYLVLERIRGKSLHKACRDAGKDLRDGLITGNKLGMKFLDYMVQMIELLSTLHKHHVVHRDVTATNFMITPTGKVAVIDMELSYSLAHQFPTPPFQLGTYGYMSPEQEATDTPTVDQDAYSMGVILLQIWTGIWPSKIMSIHFEDLAKKVRFFIPDQNFADILIRCFHPEPQLRAKLEEVKKVVVTYKQELKEKRSRQATFTKPFSRDEILDTVQQTIRTLSSALLADKEKGWFSENTSAPPHPDKRKINKGWYASFYKGAGGIIYMLNKANLVGMDIKSAQPYIEMGLATIEYRYISKKHACKPDLLFGGSGIAATLAISLSEGLIEPQAEYFDWIKRLIEIDNEVLGFQHGIAGQGIASLLSQPFLHVELVRNRLQGYIDCLLETQQKDGSWVRSVVKGKNRVSKGFVHGMSGIIYFLLEFASCYKSDDALTSAERGLNWMMKKSIRQKTIIEWRTSRGNELSYGWAEGKSGIALTLLKAWSITKDSRYREFAIRTLNSIDSKIFDPNLSQHNGLSGLGETYLEAWRLLESDEWHDKAIWITQFLMHMKKLDVKHGPYWIVKEEKQPVADFMIGNSGIIHYLLRFCYPNKVGFPLLT